MNKDCPSHLHEAASDLICAAFYAVEVGGGATNTVRIVLLLINVARFLLAFYYSLGLTLGINPTLRSKSIIGMKDE